MELQPSCHGALALGRRERCMVMGRRCSKQGCWYWAVSTADLQMLALASSAAPTLAPMEAAPAARQSGGWQTGSLLSFSQASGERCRIRRR